MWLPPEPATRLSPPHSERMIKSTHPYKSCKFLDIFTTDDMPRDAFASVLRFWTTPGRSRVRPCSETTCNIGLHLVFECPRTRAQATNYQKTLSPELSSKFQPATFETFLSVISESITSLKSFNLFLSTCDYPII